MNSRDVLEQTQVELEAVSEQAEEFTGIDRREFMFMSLMQPRPRAHSACQLA